jgi:hypothetical protein
LDTFSIRNPKSAIRNKKSLFNRRAEEALETCSRGGGQAKADASSVGAQYHHHADADTRTERLATIARLKDCGTLKRDDSKPQRLLSTRSAISP